MGKRTWSLLVVPLVALACRGAKPPTQQSDALSDDLRRDLDQASSQVSELAASRNGGHFVSALELGQSAEPAKTNVASARAPKHRAPHRTSPAKKIAPAADPEPIVTAEAPAPVQSPVIRVKAPAEPAPEPTAGPRPTPMPMPDPNGTVIGDEGNGRRSGGGMGGVIGTVIGVVIRGGAVGDDHCDPRHGNGGILINRRFPGPGGVGFPH
jgi:hypothetical protein